MVKVSGVTITVLHRIIFNMADAASAASGVFYVFNYSVTVRSYVIGRRGNGRIRPFAKIKKMADVFVLTIFGRANGGPKVFLAAGVIGGLW